MMHLFNARDGTSQQANIATVGSGAYLAHEHEPMVFYQEIPHDLGAPSEKHMHPENLFDDSDRINKRWLQMAKKHLNARRA